MVMVKEQVKELLWGESFDRYRLEAPLSKAIEYLKEVEAQILSKYPDAIEVFLEHESGYYDEPDSWVLGFTRWETDDEYAKRMVREEKKRLAAQKRKATKLQRQAEKDEYDRKVYERLKKKFEG